MDKNLGEQRKQVTSMKIGEVEDQLDRLKRLVEKVLEKLTLEDYQLANYKFKSGHIRHNCRRTNNA